MHYSLTIIYNVTSGNAINLLATAIASVSVLVSNKFRDVLGTTERVMFFSGRQIISHNKGLVLLNLVI